MQRAAYDSECHVSRYVLRTPPGIFNIPTAAALSEDTRRNTPVGMLVPFADILPVAATSGGCTGIQDGGMDMLRLGTVERKVRVNAGVDSHLPLDTAVDCHVFNITPLSYISGSARHPARRPPTSVGLTFHTVGFVGIGYRWRVETNSNVRPESTGESRLQNLPRLHRDVLRRLAVQAKQLAADVNGGLLERGFSSTHLYSLLFPRLRFFHPVSGLTVARKAARLPATKFEHTTHH